MSQLIEMADVTLVAQLLHSLPSVFAVAGTPHDVERIVSSLRAIVVARKLDRQLRVHILHALQLLCKLQTGTISIKQLAIAVASTDLAVCEHQIVSLSVAVPHACVLKPRVGPQSVLIGIKPAVRCWYLPMYM